jgi:hypothetical protein
LSLKLYHPSKLQLDYQQFRTEAPSERDWAYAKRKLSQGHDPEEIIQAIAEYRPDKHNPQKYARYTVEKAKAELNSADSSQEESRTPVDR